MRRLFHSLKDRLCFYVTGLCLIVFISIGIIFLSYSIKREEEAAISQTQLLLDNLVGQIDHRMDVIEHSVGDMTDDIYMLTKFPEELPGLLEAWLHSDSLVNGVGVAFEPYYYKEKGKYFMLSCYFDREGCLRNQRRGSVEYDYFNKAWYKEAMTSMQEKWWDPYIDPDLTNKYMTSYFIPLVEPSDTTAIALVYADVALDTFQGAVSKLDFIEGSQSFMVTEQGQFVMHWDPSITIHNDIFNYADSIGNPEFKQIGQEMVKGNRGYHQIKIDGKRAIAFYTYIPRLRMSFCNIVPYSIITKDLNAIIWLVFGIISIGLVLLIIGIRLVIKREMKPLEGMAIAAHRIGQGHFDVDIPELNDNDELRKIRDSLMNMQGSLANYVEEIKEITASKQRIENELAIAHDVQMSLLPTIFPPFPDRKELDLFATLSPAKEVGGDLYDFMVRGDTLLFALGDVSGKGVPAALYMTTTRSLFRLVADTTDAPGEIAMQLNRAICSDNKSNIFVTMFFGALDLRTGHLAFCNAGHNAPIIVPQIGDCQRLKVMPNIPLGIMEGFKFKQQEIDLGTDGLLLYSDGLTEAENGEKGQFGENRLIEIINGNRVLKASQFINAIICEVEAFVGDASQSDDLTLLYLKLTLDQHK